MINNLQNNSSKPSFGMSYAVTNSVKKTHWYEEIEKKQYTLNQNSKKLLAIFKKGKNNELDCYVFNQGNSKKIRAFQQKHPALTLFTKKIVIFSRSFLLDKDYQHGYNGTFWLSQDKSPTHLLETTKKRFNEVGKFIQNQET